MMQEEIDFDAPFCRVCSDTLIENVNWKKNFAKGRICLDCLLIERKKEREAYKKANSDPNKVWDPNYSKVCPSCEETLNAETSFDKSFSTPDGYRHYCKSCCRIKSQKPKHKHSSMKSDAKRRGYEWTLEQHDTSALFLSNCYYCGKPSQEGIKIHGLDRVENDRGYHLDNVVPCCYDCNIAKAGQTQEDFIDMCKRVANRHTTHEKSNLECRKVYLKDIEVGEIFKENFIDPIW